MMNKLLNFIKGDFSRGRKFIVLSIVALVGSCGDSDDEPFSYSDFRSVVAESFSSNVHDCGDHELDDNLSLANCCIASQAAIPMNFYVTLSFDGQGLATAWALDSSGNANVYTYIETYIPDQNGNLDRSVSVSRAVCASWSINANACSQTSGAAITCQDLGDFDEIIRAD